MSTKRMVVFFSPGRLSVEIENGVTRQVSGDPATAIRSMNPDDLGVLVAFCRAVTQMVDEPQREPMFAKGVLNA